MSAILMGSFDSGTSAAAGRAAPRATAAPSARTAKDFAARECRVMPPSPLLCFPDARGTCTPRGFFLPTIIRAAPMGVKPSWPWNGLALGLRERGSLPISRQDDAGERGVWLDVTAARRGA